MIPLQKNEFVKEKMEEGWYPAVLFQVVYLGKQKFGKDKTDKDGKVVVDKNGNVERTEWSSPQIALGFELPTVTFQNREGAELTKIMSMTLFASLSPSYRGIGFYEVAHSLGAYTDGEDEPETFDESKLAGMPCEVRVESVASKGKSYDNIVEIRPATEKFSGTRSTVTVTAEDYENELLIATLPRFIREKIFASDEWREMKEKEKESFDDVSGMPLADVRVEEADDAESVSKQLSQVRF